jgi:hypothetical protein
MFIDNNEREGLSNEQDSYSQDNYPKAGYIYEALRQQMLYNMMSNSNIYDIYGGRNDKDERNKILNINKKSDINFGSIKFTEDDYKDMDVKGIKEYIVGNQKVYLKPAAGEALMKANEEFKQKYGRDIRITYSYRPRRVQEYLWEKFDKGRKGRVAPPGRSRHEYGEAIDVVNWKEAEPYLRKYGLKNDIKDDKVHFSLTGG